MPGHRIRRSATRAMALVALGAIALAASIGSAQANAAAARPPGPCCRVRRPLLPTLGQGRWITLHYVERTVRTTRTQPNGFVAYRLQGCSRVLVHNVICQF